MVVEPIPKEVRQNCQPKSHQKNRVKAKTTCFRHNHKTEQQSACNGSRTDPKGRAAVKVLVRIVNQGVTNKIEANFFYSSINMKQRTDKVFSLVFKG